MFVVKKEYYYSVLLLFLRFARVYDTHKFLLCVTYDSKQILSVVCAMKIINLRWKKLF